MHTIEVQILEPQSLPLYSNCFEQLYNAETDFRVLGCVFLKLSYLYVQQISYFIKQKENVSETLIAIEAGASLQKIYWFSAVNDRKCIFTFGRKPKSRKYSASGRIPKPNIEIVDKTR